MRMVTVKQIVYFPNVHCVKCCQSYRRILGNRWWEDSSWSSPQTDPSCWGRGWWRCLWTTCCCRWSRTASCSRAFGSEREERRTLLTGRGDLHRLNLKAERVWELLPSPRPRPAPGRSHSEPHRRWWRWLPQSNGSTSSSQTAGRRHQTFWKEEIISKHVDTQTFAYTVHAVFRRPNGKDNRSVTVVAPVLLQALLMTVVNGKGSRNSVSPLFLEISFDKL